MVVKSKKGEVASPAFQRKCLSAFKGVKTSDGRSVEKIHDHAMFRMEQRGVYPNTAAKAIAQGKVTKGNKPNRLLYQYNGTHIIYDENEKMVVTCIYKGKGAKGK